MKTVSRYESYDREKINAERCKTLGSIYRIDLSCNRVSTYSVQYAKSEDYRFGNVFAFKSEADKAMVEVIKLYNYLNDYYGKITYYEMIAGSVYIISDNGDILEITKESVQDDNKRNSRIGLGGWTFEQYIKSWYDAENCFNSLRRAEIARNKIADIFENVKTGRYK